VRRGGVASVFISGGEPFSATSSKQSAETRGQEELARGTGSGFGLGRFVFQSAAEQLPPCRTSFVGKMVPLSLIAVALLSLVHILRDLIRPGNVLTSRCHTPTLP
jgi:hypothetical protein